MCSVCCAAGCVLCVLCCVPPGALWVVCVVQTRATLRRALPVGCLVLLAAEHTTANNQPRTTLPLTSPRNNTHAQAKSGPLVPQAQLGPRACRGPPAPAPVAWGRRVPRAKLGPQAPKATPARRETRVGDFLYVIN